MPCNSSKSSASDSADQTGACTFACRTLLGDVFRLFVDVGRRAQFVQDVTRRSYRHRAKLKVLDFLDKRVGGNVRG